MIQQPILANEKKSLISSDNLVSLFKSTGVCNKEDEVATTTRSLPNFSMALLTISEALAKSDFQIFLPSITPADNFCSGCKAAKTASNCSGALTKSICKASTGNDLTASKFGMMVPK
ncbi:hypothetical protein WICMUC_002632 [Wickerhamomyces mucosus]|uniref:Uncharacterized protein n=1 Tax=Wickerhamomyces mucosus TaxID=1378264 RepID=A0A9P8TDJ4_9ASCO|nr:hypothetical protein WICMUC_002632 [Wickerhamomyces mucosus]